MSAIESGQTELARAASRHTITLHPTWKLADLQIVGYADNRDPSMLPAIVPPVFRSISDPDTVLVPPFAIHFDYIAGATSVRFAEAEQLRDQGEITLFDGESFSPGLGHLLWVRSSGAVAYQPALEARRELDHISQRAVDDAVAALAAGDLDKAESAASEAFLANDRSLDALAIKAAIRRREKNAAGERLMADLAASLTSPAEFDALVLSLPRPPG